MKGILAGLAVAVAIGGCGGSAGNEEAAASVVALAGRVCTVPVAASGVVIDEGMVLTAAHPVAGAGAALEVVTAGGRRFPATVVGFDPERDLALLAVTGLTASVASIDVGEPGATGVIIAMAPSGETRRVPFRVQRRITATGDDIYGEGDVARQALELDADIDEGDSGAPAFDVGGRVIGVVFAESRSRGVSYAVDATEIRAFLAETEASTLVDPGRCRQPSSS